MKRKNFGLQSGLTLNLVANLNQNEVKKFMLDKEIETAPSKIISHTSGFFTLTKGVNLKQRGRAAFLIKRNDKLHRNTLLTMVCKDKGENNKR